jgi:hypothetical protein
MPAARATWSGRRMVHRRQRDGVDMEYLLLILPLVQQDTRCGTSR